MEDRSGVDKSTVAPSFVAHRVLNFSVVRKIAALSFCAAMMIRASVAHAADPDLERARALFEEAGDLERHGQWAGAQGKLREALKLRETPQLHYALGWSLENDDKLLEAKTEYEAALRLGQNRSGGEEATRLATTRLADLEKKMPIIKVRVTGGAKATARVVVDGKEIKRDDDVATTPVNPGSHVIRVERTGTEEAIEQMAYVGRSTVRSVDVDTGDVVTSGGATQDRHIAVPLKMSLGSTTTSGGNDRVLPWILVSAGAAAMAGGVVLLVASKGDASERDEAQSRWCVMTACNGIRATLPESSAAAALRKQSVDAADAGNTKQAIGFAIGGVGLATAALGAYLFVKGGEKSSGTTASATPLPGGGYASASFRF